MPMKMPTTRSQQISNKETSGVNRTNKPIQKKKNTLPDHEHDKNTRPLNQNQNLYSSLDGAVGGFDFNLSTDSHDYISCSEEIISEKCKQKGKQKEEEKNKQKNKQPIAKSKPRSKKKEINIDDHSSEINSQNRNIFIDELDLNLNKSSISELLLTIKSLHNSVMFISQQYDTLLKKNEELHKSHEEILKENKLLKIRQNKQSDDTIIMKKELDRISWLINTFEQEKLENAIVMKSLPELSNLDSKQVVANVASKLDVKIETQEVNSIQKIPLKNNQKFDYIFKLKSIQTKNAILDSCKSVKMILKPDLSVESVDNFDGVSGPRIFITNHMTSFNYALLRKAKLLHNFGFRYVWYKFGKVFARESNNSNCHTIRITSLDIVDEIILQRSRSTLNFNTNTT